MQNRRQSTKILGEIKQELQVEDNNSVALKEVDMYKTKLELQFKKNMNLMEENKQILNENTELKNEINQLNKANEGPNKGLYANVFYKEKTQKQDNVSVLDENVSI